MHPESFGRIAQKSLFLYCEQSCREKYENLLELDEMSIDIALKIFPVKYIFYCTPALCNELTNEI